MANSMPLISRLAITKGALMAGLSEVSQSKALARNGRPSTSLPGDDGGIGARVVSRIAPKHYGVVMFVTYDPEKHKDGASRK